MPAPPHLPGPNEPSESSPSRVLSPHDVLGTIPHEGVSLEALPPFLRTLLVTDGTVTKSLEAYYWEPIRVETVRQDTRAADADIPWLGVKAGEQVIERRVTLRGDTSQTVFTRASSLIRPQQIPEQLRRRLISGSLGIGELIRNCGLETYRELLEIGATTLEDGEHIYRRYRIVLAQQPGILITERFPVAVFRDGR